MTLYQHRFLGHTADGEGFMYTWWASSVRSLLDAHNEALTWNNTLWAGATAGNGLEDHITADVGMDTVTTVRVDAATGLQDARTDSADTNVGVAAGSALPADVALVISLRTALANRRGRGRFYLPQPAASQVTTAGRVLADFITDLGASLTAAWGGYNTASDFPVVYSRASRNFTPITSFDIGNLYDTQRRRENKVTEARTSSPMP